MYRSHLSLLVAVNMLVLLGVLGCSSGGGGTGESGSPSASGSSVPTPVADFSATPTTGPLPLAVQFSDASTGSISTWAWNFGDGATSSVQNPQHTYSTAGSYTVSLTVSGAGGSNSTTKINFVTVSPPPAPPASPPPAPPASPPPAPPASPPPAPPASPLSVAITAPASGATVFDLVSVVATVSDNVSVAGVQFFIDGAPFGAEVTVEPYTVAWDTTTASPGSHSLAARARDVAGNTTLSAPVSVTVVAVTTALHVGQWSTPIPWPIVAVNAVLLRTGQILTWDGLDHGHDARLWDIATGVFTAVPNSQTNMFCTGMCAMADGRTLVAGGHAVPNGHVGLTDTNLFDPVARTWTKVASMNFPRWYPTTTVLPDGRVLVTAGEMNGARNTAVIPEVYSQGNGWTKLDGASLDLPYYPHMFVLPDGRVLAASTAEDPIMTQVLDLSTQTWSIVDPTPVDGGSAAMYRLGKVMKCGTSTDPDMPVFASAATTYVLDMTKPSPAWRQTAPMAFPRTYHNLTLLPDGTVLVTGGGATTDRGGLSGAVHEAELWSPATETWTTMAPMQTPRLYHSTALLLPDGRVLSVGGGRFTGDATDPNQLSAEFYAPPYLFKGTRPTMSAAPATATYGGTITVQTPDAGQIATVSLLRLGAATHAFNMDQRFLQLTFTAGNGALTVQAPANANLAPPGSYMLFILNTNGVPSVAATLQLG